MEIDFTLKEMIVRTEHGRGAERTVRVSPGERTTSLLTEDLSKSLGFPHVGSSFEKRKDALCLVLFSSGHSFTITG